MAKVTLKMNMQHTLTSALNTNVHSVLSLRPR